MIQTFTINGMPVAWQRPQSGVSKRGRPFTYTPNKTLSFQREVQRAAMAARIRAHQGVVAMTIRFFGSRGDIDNLAKSILDGLNAIAYNDDKQVEELHVFVDRRGKPARTEVEIATKEPAA